MELQRLIRDVPDFPRPGVMFKDITPLLANVEALAVAVDAMAEPFVGSRVTTVAGIEARGFLFGPLVAQRLQVGFVPLRKSGKLPSEVIAMSYDLEYGSDRLEMHRDSVTAESHVLLIDDVLATGGTLRAGIDLVEAAGASVIGASVLIELAALDGADKIAPTTFHKVIEVN